jgi:hypothetical protein
MPSVSGLYNEDTSRLGVSSEFSHELVWGQLPCSVDMSTEAVEYTLSRTAARQRLVKI